MREHAETLAVEIAKTISHGIGVALSIAGFVFLIGRALQGETPWPAVAVGIYGASLILVYLSSTLYHGTWHRGLKPVLAVVDECAIFLLIAGTYTPVTLLALPGPYGWTVFAAIWALAVGGVLLRILWPRCFERCSIALYLVMGWLGIGWVKPLIDGLGPAGSGLLLLGGAAYTAGVAFYLWRTLRFNHMVWHLFVIAGSASHFCAVAFYALPAAI